MLSIRNFSAAAAILAVSFTTSTYAGLITNGDFETGDFTGWTTSQLGGSTLVVVADPGDSNLGASPTSDSYAFAGNQSGPSQNIFLQSFMVPTDLLSFMLSFDYTYQNFASSFVNPSPDTLAFNGGSNQQFRVEILNGTSAFDSVDTSDIIFSALQTVPNSPNPQPWTMFSQDITSAVTFFEGQSLQLRFAQADNQGPFDVGFDNVVLAAQTGSVPVPEPATLALLCAGLLGLRLHRRSS